MELLAEWIFESWNVIAESAPWILAGFALAGVIHVLMPAKRIVAQLGGPGLGGVLKASLVGIPLPLCSCSVIPVASSLRKQGAGRGATTAFLISTPETSVDSIAISYALLGPLLTVARPVAAFLTATLAGGLIGAFGRPDSTEDKKRESAGGSIDTAETPCRESCACGDPVKAGTPRDGRWRTGVRFALVDMFADLSHWLLLGFAVAGLVSAAVPEAWFERHLGAGIVAMLVMVVFGMPLYVCSTSSTPVAAAMIATGLSPGAALVFLLVGPATNLATMGVVARDLGGKSLLIYLSSIITVALAFGIFTDAIVGATSTVVGVFDSPDPPCCTPANLPFAVVLSLLMLNGLWVRLRRRAGTRGA